MAVRAVHLDLVEHREGDEVFARAELFDFLVGARFLFAELVAREAEDDKTLVCIFVVGRLERLVLRREPAVRGDVDDENDLAFVGAQCGGLAVNVLDRDVVNGSGADGKICHKRKGKEQRECFHGIEINRNARFVK